MMVGTSIIEVFWYLYSPLGEHVKAVVVLVIMDYFGMYCISPAYTVVKVWLISNKHRFCHSLQCQCHNVMQSLNPKDMIKLAVMSLIYLLFLIAFSVSTYFCASPWSICCTSVQQFPAMLSPPKKTMGVFTGSASRNKPRVR